MFIGTQFDIDEMLAPLDSKVSTYTLMHENTVVLKAYEKENRVEVLSATHTPFALRGAPLDYAAFYQWMCARVNHLQRMYMNAVYIMRQVGRDFNEILRDSCAISVIDNFWIKRSDVDMTWERLNQKRDINTRLVQAALTGKITEESFNKPYDDTTSLFTIAGAFPKAILGEYILKQGNNAEYEVAASQLGEFLGVLTANATLSPKDKVIRCRLFTSGNVSMAHAKDFAKLAALPAEGTKITDVVHDYMYRYFKQQGRTDIVTQLERLYIFQFLVENMDFHEENFGFLYDPATFKVLQVAPAYDFNSAFEGWCIPDAAYNEWLGENVTIFIMRHTDIAERMRLPEFADFVKKLPLERKEQFDTVLLRAEYLCGQL